jgi:hypothetical protein
MRQLDTNQHKGNALEGAITYRRLEIKVALVIPSLYLEAQVGKHFSQFHVHSLWEGTTQSQIGTSKSEAFHFVPQFMLA